MTQPINNPVTGHTITFLQTAKETKGRLLQIEYLVERPEQSEKYIPLHYHGQTLERFKVSSGRLGVLIGKDKMEHILETGESIDIRAGTPHTFWNAGDIPVRFITDVEPAGQLQMYWETVFGLAKDGKTDKKGLPNLLQLAVLFPVMDTFAPNIPASVQKMLFGLFGIIGRLIGYRSQYPKYSGGESTP